MCLDSPRLYLKRLSHDELAGNYVSWLNDPEVCRYNSHGDTLYTREMAAEFIAALDGDGSREVYAVYLKKDMRHIGNISLQRIDGKNRHAEIAYLFGEKDCWGEGYATEASEILLQRAFNELRLHRVYFGTHIENLGMRKVGEKLGFLKEGVLKEALFKNGKFVDLVLYGKVSEK